MSNNDPKLVRDLMTVGVATCPPDTPVADIARLLLERDLESLIVLDPGEGHALGMVGREELMRAYTRPEVRSLKAEDVMSHEVLQVPPDIPLTAAAQIMLDQSVRALFLMHHAGGVVYPAGVITFQHLLRHLAARNIEELKDLGIHATRQSPLEAYFQRRDAARRRNAPDK